MVSKGLSYKVLLILVAVIWQGTLSARPKSAGATFSLSGISLSYEYETDRDSFMDFSIKTELADLYFGKGKKAGYSFSFTWNNVLKEWKSGNGERMRFYIGPGAALGYGKDYKTNYGLFFGLKGRIGYECLFERGVCLSVGIAPIFGQHVTRSDEAIVMRGYRNGLIYGLTPEIGVRYSF